MLQRHTDAHEMVDKKVVKKLNQLLGLNFNPLDSGKNTVEPNFFS